MLYVPCESSFISTKFFVLNLVGWFGVLLTNLIFFDIPLSSFSKGLEFWSVNDTSIYENSGLNLVIVQLLY